MTEYKKALRKAFARIKNRPGIKPHYGIVKRLRDCGALVKSVRFGGNTEVRFVYRGHECTIVCGGKEIENKKGFYPTFLTVNNIKRDVSGLEIATVLLDLKPKKIVVVRKMEHTKKTQRIMSR